MGGTNRIKVKANSAGEDFDPPERFLRHEETPVCEFCVQPEEDCQCSDGDMD